MKKLILIGGGGHCRSCIEAIESSGDFIIAGLLDNDPEVKQVLGYDVLGGDGLISDLVSEGYEFLITLGQIRNAEVRKALSVKIRECGGQLATVVASTARVSRHAVIGAGGVVMHGAVINAGAKVGENAIVNTGAVIEHDVVTGDHCHISTGALINGGCLLGDEVFIGSGSVLRQEIKVVSGTVTGAGSVVVKDITEKGIYAGNPAKRIDYGR